MNKGKIVHFASTGLLSVFMLMSAGMYFFKHADIVEAFTALGYPVYLIYPLATAKLLGLTAIWTRISPTLKSLAYAGFFYDFLLAAMAHLAAGDGQSAPSFVALALLGASYWSQRKLAADAPALGGAQLAPHVDGGSRGAQHA